MRRIGIFSLGLMVLPELAAAHAGHLVDVAGHDHLLAGAAIGIAIAIGLAGALKGRRDDDEDADDTEAETQELNEA